MSAEFLRRAATAMREDALALDDDVAWHPAVALAVADWLDSEAATVDDLMAGTQSTVPYHAYGPAFELARIYLGEPA